MEQERNARAAVKDETVKDEEIQRRRAQDKSVRDAMPAQVRAAVERRKDMLLDVNQKIHGFAELAYEEVQSAALLQSKLREEGFTINTGLADIPTAFMASWGSGRPVMGILGEYDALDALSQISSEPARKPEIEGAPGHGCGHCALGTASMGAAMAVKDYLEKNHLPGTIVYFGCPAEEGAGSKQFMARAGAFDDVDFCYTWHPAARNEVSADASLAIMGAAFTFDGIAAHAGGCPWLGRSALDAAELMNVGCNYLREHIPDGQRVHYAYRDAGGTQPNVVPAHAEVKYEVRAKTNAEAKQLLERVVDVARGAALMTGTGMSYRITMAFSDFRSDPVLAGVLSEALRDVGAPRWEEDDYALAAAFRSSYDEQTRADMDAELEREFGDRAEEKRKRPLDDTVLSFDPRNAETKGGSTDVGDVSYVTPTAELHIACACLGNIGHTWQMTGQAGSRIAEKGLLTAAQVMALACLRLRGQPEQIKKAQENVKIKNGGRYICPLPPEVKPPIGIY